MLRRARSGRSTNRRRPNLRWIGLVAIGACSAASGSASDGVFEVNQVCAVETGCAPGDLPGFPISIGTPGSYRLTSNLSAAPDQNANVIEIWSPLVTLDLAGFSIIGPAAYGGPGGFACAPPGTGVGILAVSSVPADNVSVSNGHVRGMASNGIVLTSNSLVQGVTTEQNCGTGITVGLGSSITQSTARKNGVNGIVLDRGSQVSHSVADSNGANGIRNINGDVLIQGCTANANGGDGINVGVRTMIRSSVANRNLGDGIETANTSTVLESTASENAIWGMRGVGAHGLNTLIGNIVSNVVPGYAIACSYGSASGSTVGTRYCP